MLILTVLFWALAADAPQFVNVDEEAGLAITGGEPLLAFGDYDADGDPDLLIDGRRLFRNESTRGEARFVEVTSEAGIAGARGPSACWFDFDLDGRLDFGSRSGEVWINAGKGRFIDFTGPLGIELSTGSASASAWGDLDGDGWLDFFSGGNNTYDPLTHYPQSVWLNHKRKKPLASLKTKHALARLEPMLDASREWGVTLDMYGRSIIFCDFDWDGDEDVYSGNYHLKPNFLYRNDGEKLAEVAREYGVTGLEDPERFTLPDGQKVGYQFGHTIGAAWADLDNDGYFDLWVANLVHKYAGATSDRMKEILGSDFDVRGYVCDDSNLFMNQGPPAYHFVDERVERGIPRRPSGPRGVFVGDELWSNAVCGDLDNDGFVDVFCNQIYGNLDYSYGVLYMNDAGEFSEQHEAAGISVWGGYGSAVADLDSDGWLDLLVCGALEVDGERGVHIYLNSGEGDGWLGLNFEQRKGQQTIGTKVLLIQQEGVQLRQLATTSGSHTQQNDGRVHFGLGSGGALRDVLVYWPDGVIQSLGPLERGQYHSVHHKSLARKRFVLQAAARARVGEAVELTATDLGKGFEYSWDWRGSRAAELESETSVATIVFDEAGSHLVCVRATRPGRQAFEARVQIDVRE